MSDENRTSNSDRKDQSFCVNASNYVRPKTYRRRLMKAVEMPQSSNEQDAISDVKYMRVESEGLNIVRDASVDGLNRTEPVETPQTNCMQNTIPNSKYVGVESEDLDSVEGTSGDNFASTEPVDPPQTVHKQEAASDVNYDMCQGLEFTEDSSEEDCDINALPGSLVDKLLNELAKDNNWDKADDTDSDSEIESDDFCGELDQPLSPGHTLTLKTSILMVWMFAIAHCLTAAQLTDLLTLINLHLMVSHPVYNSLHRFKTVLNKDFSTDGLKKHFFCSCCFQSCVDAQDNCSNKLCSKKLDKGNRSHFIELDIICQLKNLYKRKEFVNSMKHHSEMKKKSPENIEDVHDGLLYQHLFSDNDPTNEDFNLSFIFNTDGVPIFKSSKTSIWPIFLMINELPFKMRSSRDYMLMAGLWCGPTKPAMNLFLAPMKKSFDILGKGIRINDQRVKGYLHSVSCDLPARSAVMNMNNHNGEFSCIKCFQKGLNHRTCKGGNVRVFPYTSDSPDGPSRNHDDIVSDARIATETSNTIRGIKGGSIIMFCPKFDCVNGVAIDYMHMLCLGLVRMLLKLWFNVSNGSELFSLYKHITVVDDRLSKIKVPQFIARTPRSISEHLKFWKAAELRSWFYYYSVPCLTGLLKPRYLYHYCALVQAMFLLNQNSISPNDLLVAEKMLQYFVFMLPSLYSEKCLTLNAHSLLHLPQLVRELGPIWCYSCFAFEGANGELLKMFHGTQFIDLQIANAVNIFQLLPTATEDICPTDVAYKFIKSLTSVSTGRECHSEGKCYFMGKPYHRQVNLDTDIKIREFLGCPFGDLQIDFFNRAKLNGQVFHSKAYTRVSKRNCYSVQFCLNEQICYGSIVWFASSMSKLFACIEILDKIDQNVFTQYCEDDEDALVTNNFMGISLLHINFLKKCGKECIVSLDDIQQMCICVEFDNTICFCLEPNDHERNL